ncbi:MAG: NADH-quinone oxidoreductase subunit C [Candidatus Hydrogenedentes bacterium]|nr:NADH-quinone oxidoreductase subunit C [Candidatus Hydrogenedentota bacterium]
MDPEKLLALIESICPTVRHRAHADRAALSIAADELLALMAVLRDDPALRFDFLVTHTAIDLPDEKCFELVYLLYASEHGHSLFVTTRVDRDNPVVPSVCGLWPIAEWQEREVYDLMGVLYDEHPDLRRMFLEDDWVGFPLRKDYQDEHMLELPK